MAYILACLMAALSFLLNRAALKYMGVKVIISYSPVVEEAVKTVPAFLLGADILLTHISFGILEAGYDFCVSRRHGLAAAALSIVGHSLFGLITIGVISITGSIFPGLGAGIVAHLVWNVTAVRLTV